MNVNKIVNFQEFCTTKMPEIINMNDIIKQNTKVPVKRYMIFIYIPDVLSNYLKKNISLQYDLMIRQDLPFFSNYEFIFK